MIGYSFSLKIIRNFFKSRKLEKNYDHQPTVTVMVVAHNEEKVILEKLKNIICLNYPKDKIKYLIASDNSTDKTNEIVRDFIEKNKEFNIKLYEVKQRKGKTNAQNEAQKLVDTEFLVMTDANSMMDKNSVLELMSAFTDENIAYVTGKLVYINDKDSSVSKSESIYWDELPELINILKGDMSIVGPRPLRVYYLPWYTEEEKHRHDVRPGLTGWAQVNGRNNLDWDKRLALDVEYVRNISFAFDVKIIFMTVAYVFKRSDVNVDSVDEGRLDEIRKAKVEKK